MIKLLLATGAIALASTSALGQTRLADRPHWYLGGGTGFSEIEQNISDTSLSIAGATSSDFIAKTSSTPARFIIGFQPTRHLAIEGGYQYFGEYNVRRVVHEPVAVSGSYDVRWKVKGPHLDLLAVLPVMDSFKLIGKVGVMRAETDLTASCSCSTTTVKESGSRWALRYGAAIEVALTERLSFRADAEVTKGASNSNQVNVGGEEINYQVFTGNLLYRF